MTFIKGDSDAGRALRNLVEENEQLRARVKDLEAQRSDFEWAHDAWKELAYTWFGPGVNVEYGGSLQVRMLVIPEVAAQAIAERDTIASKLAVAVDALTKISRVKYGLDFDYTDEELAKYWSAKAIGYEQKSRDAIAKLGAMK